MYASRKVSIIRYYTFTYNAVVYRFIFAVIVSLGAVFSPENVWTVSDIFNGLMAVPNILALLLLFRKVRI